MCAMTHSCVYAYSNCVYISILHTCHIRILQSVYKRIYILIQIYSTPSHLCHYSSVRVCICKLYTDMYIAYMKHAYIIACTERVAKMHRMP